MNEDYIPRMYRENEMAENVPMLAEEPRMMNGYQAKVDLTGVRALTNAANGRHYLPVYLFLGDGEVHEVGKVDGAQGAAALARLLRMVADRLDP